MTFERCVVLVADDEPTVLQLVSYALRRHAYEVIPATDGPSALRACANGRDPHLALLDMMMPGMTGPELYDCLRALYPKMEVLFMSGYRPEQIPSLPANVGEAHFIAKPFKPRDLVERVNQILGNEDVCALLEDEVSVGA